jgi:hypothetical protein
MIPMAENIPIYNIPEDRFEAFKEAQKLSGLNQNDFDVFLRVLSKCAEANVTFGNLEKLCLHFSVHALTLNLSFSLDTGLIEKENTFRFTLKELGLSETEPLPG